MFGKGMIKLVGYAIAGAIALIAGAELLSSVVSIVLAFRFGNPLPLLAVILVTVFLLFITGRVSKETPAQMVLLILSYVSTGYLIVVCFVIVLPYSLIVSILTAAVIAAVSSFLRDSKQITHVISQINHQLHITKRIVTVGDRSSLRPNSNQNILLLEEGSRNKLFQLMRDRPLLPISYTHYVGCDVLFIIESSDSVKFDRIMKLLRDYDIHTIGPASQLLSEAIQKVPVIDSRHGLNLDDYRMTRDDIAITNLLESCPPRLTVFPTTTGLVALVPDIEAPGLNLEPIKRGHEQEVLLQRNYGQLQEVEKQVESTP
ncbi:hypothetical protein EU527_02520 [Candidatus Thorarchaeota archaeon]|nr:MAG: hypothetical protein EU527_02520 [Candidatus Thorarchaeota archaeon]